MACIAVLGSLIARNFVISVWAVFALHSLCRAIVHTTQICSFRNSVICYSNNHAVQMLKFVFKWMCTSFKNTVTSSLAHLLIIVEFWIQHQSTFSTAVPIWNILPLHHFHPPIPSSPTCLCRQPLFLFNPPSCLSTAIAIFHWNNFI